MNKKHSKTMVILAFLGMKNDMKRLAVFSVFVLFCQVLDATNPYSANTNKSEGAVSFVVDENLPTPEYNLNHSCVTEIWGALLSRCQVSNKDLNILFVSLQDFSAFLCIKAAWGIEEKLGYELATVLNSTFCYKLHQRTPDSEPPAILMTHCRVQR